MVHKVLLIATSPADPMGPRLMSSPPVTRGRQHMDGVSSSATAASGTAIAIMYALNLLGLCFDIAAVPERFISPRYNYTVYGHTLLHACVVAAAASLWHGYATL